MFNLILNLNCAIKYFTSLGENYCIYLYTKLSLRAIEVGYENSLYQFVIKK